jgi:deferrochelatase/peroxidase EfeB
MGAFQALMKMVDDMAWTTVRRYLPTSATSDENTLKLAYGNAYADLWHKATNKEDHLYDHNRDLLNELLGKFFPSR